MKTLLVKLQFKMAGWLYNQGIIAPQLLEHPDGTSVRNIKILTPDESKNIEMVMKEGKPYPHSLSFSINS